MSLDTIVGTLKQEYRSDTDNIHRDFYVPCLTNALKYDRAVGYFTSDSLALVARGLVPFVSNAGSLMRLVASPVLNLEDEKAIYERPAEEQLQCLTRLLTESVDKAIAQASHKHLAFLSWMVFSGKIQIKLAFRPNHRGIFHEKIGIFTDSNNSHVVFTGSMNETGAGMSSNLESFDVYTEPADLSRIKSKIAHFESLWSQKHPNLTVIDFTDASKALLERYRRPEYRPPVNEGELHPELRPAPLPVPAVLRTLGTLATPHGLAPFDYQQEAINTWLASESRGILEMATGTGKTLTALFSSLKVQELTPKLCIVIVVPFKHLGEQWAKDVRRFGVKPILCYDSKEQWHLALSTTIERLNLSERGTIVACVTNATFQGDSFLGLINSSDIPLFIIGDEVHNLGAGKIGEVLPTRAQYRLGLSATPVRQGDEEGTQTIFDYFGESVYSFSLKQAIERKILTPYEYYPIYVPLTEWEATKYKELTAQYAQYASSNDPELKDRAEKILFERANLTGAAYHKTEALIKQLVKTPLDKGLVYCSPGKVMSPDGEEIDTQINLVVTKLRQSVPPVTISQFVNFVEDEERKRLISDISNGSAQGLAAIRCLDEGVDIPDLKQAFILASSRNYRQSVQRRGRLLRRAEGKTKAFLYDFVVVHPSFHDQDYTSLLDWEKSLLTSELKRCAEFADLSTNRVSLLLAMAELRNKYQIQDGQ